MRYKTGLSFPPGFPPDHSKVIPMVITETLLFKYIENFTTKNWKFSDKNFDIFHISAQNIVSTY